MLHEAHLSLFSLMSLRRHVVPLKFWPCDALEFQPYFLGSSVQKSTTIWLRLQEAIAAVGWMEDERAGMKLEVERLRDDGLNS